jgi:hypothetical protein
MESRNILNYLGDIIGVLELPSGTSEETWQKKLAVYALPPQKVFVEITPRQIRLQLLKLGITSQMVIDAIGEHIQEPDKTVALIEWDHAISFNRYAPFVDCVGQLLGLTTEQIDNLWIDASGI